MKILITGIAGTVGVAFTEHLHKDNQVYGIDRNEENVAKFVKKYPKVPVIVGDFDELELNQPIDVLIHLAAMKHIDLCETQPSACILNNIVKTYNLFKKAHVNGTDILFMSTDKAVEPSSIYGYSKAIMEGMALELGGAFARSGNIVDSNGSVLQAWDKAIENFEPIKITHKNMRRFFITPEHLVKRVWHKYEKGIHEIIPDMDEDISLVELANRKLAPLTIDDYPPGVEYIGLRPGEKIVEKLRWGK